jgi:hypothetical protein
MPRDNDGTKPERHGKPWNDTEEKFVLDEIAKKTPIFKIAEDVRRTSGGVYSHLKVVATKYVENGMTLEEASELTGVTIEDIRDHITRVEIANKSKQTKGLVQQTLNFPIQKEETLLSVAIEIRDLLKQLVNSK